MTVNGPADDTDHTTETTAGPEACVRLPYGAPSPGLLARADRGLARFLNGFGPTTTVTQQPVGRNGTGTSAGDHRR
ncbi:hypothetical protein [Streptomyces sp. NPDC059874]|uniref:hypothetical protein n=1 Tax=Streptomyces sp. NPDC059874 TaxID=3346983 RepID=UPI00364863CD